MSHNLQYAITFALYTVDTEYPCGCATFVCTPDSVNSFDLRSLLLGADGAFRVYG